VTALPKLKLDVLRKLLADEIKTRQTSETEKTQKKTNNDSETELISNEGKTKRAGMAESKIKLDFEAGQDDWETFVERLELYFLANEITDELKRKAILLTKVSANTYTLIRDLCAPLKPKDKTFEELKGLIKKYLSPEPSETVERYKFHKATQTASESVAEFVARLKKLSIYCKFTELNTALRDQLVCGLRDHDSRVLLFREKNLTFDNAYKIAVGQEKATANANIAGNVSAVE